MLVTVSPNYCYVMLRFSPSDWSASNIDHYNSADSSRNQSERIRNEAVRLIR